MSITSLSSKKSSPVGRNAQQEFLNALKSKGLEISDVLAVKINIDSNQVNGADGRRISPLIEEDEEDDYGMDPINGLEIILYSSATPTEIQEFLEKLDFYYDGGYGSQHLFGLIWINGGSWFERWEYDGSEGWDYKICPTLPASLQRDSILHNILKHE